MATKVISWNTGSGNITLTYQGQGNGPITVQSDDNDVGTARSQTITVETVGGAIVKNLTVSQGACPFPVGDVKNYAYTGAKQTVLLPAGTYKLQCWGAQGGSNGTNSSYGITAKAGGKGGYSEGVLTLTSPTEVEINVGGQGSASAGGFNGGGSTTGTSQYNASNEFGISKMGGGGGATDIRLKDGGLLSRFIVAGGGSGGAMCYRRKTTSSTESSTVNGSSLSATNLAPSSDNTFYGDSLNWGGAIISVSRYRGWSYTVTKGSAIQLALRWDATSSYPALNETRAISNASPSGTVPSNAYWMWVGINYGADNPGGRRPDKIVFSHQTSSTSTSTDYQVGGVGGGTQGGAYSSTYAGKQNAAGSGGSFGQGAAQSVTNYRYCSGAGGGGWYGGGSSYSDSSMTNCKYGGGGSGFVNTAASAGNRPSGYTGLELDSGTTIDGTHSFEAPGGGTETGHSGNGYVRITRLY